MDLRLRYFLNRFNIIWLNDYLRQTKDYYDKKIIHIDLFIIFVIRHFIYLYLEDNIWNSDKIKSVLVFAYITNVYKITTINI